jgi:hypothetical protein
MPHGPPINQPWPDPADAQCQAEERSAGAAALNYQVVVRTVLIRTVIIPATFSISPGSSESAPFDAATNWNQFE